MTTRVPASMLGALAPSGGSDTAALQAALATGRDVLLSPGTYLAANLTMSTASQRLVALGNVRIHKNANGPILTVSAADCVIEGVGFRGDAASPTFTGDNVVISGDNCRLVNCGSRWASGAAVKATGQALQIIGTCDLYQTATGSGYDIDVGVSGTATLYHQITNIRTSQATGGIRFTDCGSPAVQGSQFGKLVVATGTSPSGVNGGMYTGNRILGDVTVAISGAVFSANQFGAVAITFSGGTSGHSLDGSNSLASGATITDSSTGSNVDDLRTAVWTSYTPTWTASVNPTLGNGTLVGRYVRRGNLITASTRLTFGSTSAAGTGAWYFSLPAVPSTALPQIGSALIFDSGTNFLVAAAQTMQDGTARMQVIPHTGAAAAGPGVPITWATGDEVRASITYSV